MLQSIRLCAYIVCGRRQDFTFSNEPPLVSCSGDEKHHGRELEKRFHLNKHWSSKALKPHRSSG